jgi:hypothetical protein
VSRKETAGCRAVLLEQAHVEQQLIGMQRCVYAGTMALPRHCVQESLQV